ncbi:MAG: DUF1592 domain-containing protein, partial [Sandaracinus sp.]|nr:DUF1592 domain-containing protein [Sandaracinus sp.]
MRSFGERRLGTAARALMAATLASCVGDIGSPEGGGPSRPPPPVFCGDDTLSLGAIATRRLSPVEQHNTLADLLPGVTFEAYAFAPQTTEHGFENFVANTGSVPDTHVEAYAFNALRAAAATVADPDGLARVVGCSAWETEPERDACRDVLLDEFSLRAHRRPITEAQRESYRTFFESVRDEIDFEAAVELTLASMLQAPESTYRVEASVSEGLDGWEIASRLSYFLWQSMPDDVLFEAAAEGALQRPRELRAQVERMLDDPRATAALTDFHRQWLRFDQMFDPRHSAKDPATFPEWTPELQASVREEAPRFVAHLMQDDATATLEALLTSRTALVDAELAAHYGLPAVEGWTEVELPADERAGFLTRANFLAGRGNAGRLSPIHSGLFVIERMLCGTIGQPDE